MTAETGARPDDPRVARDHPGRDPLAMPDPASPPRRRSAGPRRSEASHAAIIAAAEEILAEKGFSGITFEAVARRAGAGKPTLYRWWPTRTALMLEVYRRHKDKALSRPDTGSLARDLEILLSDLWRFWREGPGGRAYAAIIGEAQHDDRARAALAGQLDDPEFPMTPIFQRAVARGEIADMAEAAALREYLAALNWFRLLTGRLDEADVPRLVAALVDRRGPHR